MVTNLIDLQGKIGADGKVEEGPQFLLTNFCSNLRNKGMALGGEDLEVTPTDAVSIIEVIMLAMSDVARDIKTKNNPAAAVIDSLKNEPILSLRIDYEPGTSDNPEGSWEPSYVFGTEDLGENCKLYSVSETKYHGRFVQRAKQAGFHFNNSSLIFAAILCWAESLVNYLDNNAVEGDEVVVKHPGYFTAKVNVVNGKKVMSLIMEEEVSNIAKGDDELQVFHDSVN